MRLKVKPDGEKNRQLAKAMLVGRHFSHKKMLEMLYTEPPATAECLSCMLYVEPKGIAWKTCVSQRWLSNGMAGGYYNLLVVFPACHLVWDTLSPQLVVFPTDIAHNPSHTKNIK